MLVTSCKLHIDRANKCLLVRANRVALLVRELHVTFVALRGENFLQDMLSVECRAFSGVGSRAAACCEGDVGPVCRKSVSAARFSESFIECRSIAVKELRARGLVPVAIPAHVAKDASICAASTTSAYVRATCTRQRECMKRHALLSGARDARSHHTQTIAYAETR